MAGKHREPRDGEELRRAIERLLAWGFSPKCISQQLDCSVSWVYAVRRERGEMAVLEDDLATHRLVG